ncbi:MAG: hypothetical protein K6G70_07460 [Bacteroidaceae bacterium]|nr:hypothetical protein [Bacteroidaceae bacterium]
MINNKLYWNGRLGAKSQWTLDNGQWTARPVGTLDASRMASGLRGRHRALSFMIYYLSFIISLTCLTSCCSSDDEEVVPAVQGTEQGTLLTPIRFSGAMAEEQEQSAGAKGNGHRTYGANKANGTYETNGAYGTRAAGTPLSESATQFKVWGFKNIGDGAGYTDYQTVFPGYAVNWLDGSAASSTTNSSGWEYVMSSPVDQTIKYWDWDAKAYRFAARTTAIEANEEISVNALTGATELKITIPDLYGDKVADAPLFSKLWFSTGTPAEYPDKQFGKPVVLEFVKPFTKVRFMFISADPTVKIEDMELDDMMFKPTDDSGIGVNGSVTVTYPITGSNLRERFDSTPTNTITAMTQDYVDIYFTQAEIGAATSGDPAYGKTTSDVKTPGKWYTVLPVSSQGSFTLSLMVYGEPRTAVVPAGYMTWKAGYQYTYIFKVSGDGGVEFGDLLTAFTGWKKGFTGSESVYNW